MHPAVPRALQPGTRLHRLILSSLLAGTGLGSAASAWAQTTTGAYFPTGNSGYDQQLGVTVLSRLRPDYESQGIKFGSITVRPNLDQSIFNNSNVNGSSGPNSGSWGAQTSASVAAQSDWTRNSLSASAGFSHFQFFSLPSETYTDWNVGLSGGYTIGENPLTLSYSHQSYNQLGTTIGTVQSQTPALNQTDTAELFYTFNSGRFAFTPTLDYSAYRMGAVTLGGVQQSQAFLDHNVLAGGVVTRYALTDQSGLLFVVRGVDSHYLNALAGQPSNDSTSVLVLTGLDFQAQSVWRYSLLVGVENRSFAASQYATETAPIVSGTIVYSPTGVLTVTGTASRTIEDPSSTGTSGFVLNQARLVVDYELMRNVLLQARAGVQFAQYLQSGTQTNESVGIGATWLINRNLQLSLNEDYTTQSSPTNSTSNTFQTPADQSGGYNQNLVALALHIGF